MRSRVARLLLAFGVVALIGACAGAPQTQAPVVDTAAVHASVDSITKAFAAAMAARDTDAVVAFYASDARVLPANGPRADGHGAIRAAWVGFMSMPGMELVPTTRDVIVSEAGDMAVELGSYTMKGTGSSGKPFQDVGKYVTIYKKTDAGWKIIVDTFNSDQSPPM
ncbi:MAG TPA: DUF4440 domain-containing protein [Candidatus Limnocylindria bacterium]|nr:DUF4440 domain-containing protein [Candidatus Limnocylindria bacterium]